MKHGGIAEILATGQFPGVAGVSDGPGSGANEIVFDRPDPAKDIKLTLNKMEASGALKNPALRRLAEFKANQVKHQLLGPTVDYQKGGHPLDD